MGERMHILGDYIEESKRWVSLCGLYRGASGDMLTARERGRATCRQCLRSRSLPQRPTVRTMHDTTTMDAGYYEASGCAEQSERGRITGAGQFHYEGNSTTIPAFLLSWCTAPTPGDDLP